MEMQPVVLLSRCDVEEPPHAIGHPLVKEEMVEMVVGEVQEVQPSVSTLQLMLALPPALYCAGVIFPAGGGLG